MIKGIICHAAMMAIVAIAVALPGVALAEERGTQPTTTQQDGRERAGTGQEPGRSGDGRNTTRPEVRRCEQAVREHNGNKDDLRRCVAAASYDEFTRPEARRCAEAVKEHNGDRDDLRRCLLEAKDSDTSVNAERPGEAVSAPSSLLERIGDEGSSAPD